MPGGVCGKRASCVSTRGAKGRGKVAGETTPRVLWFFFLPLSPFFSTIQRRILEAPPRLALAELRPINPRGSKTTSFARFPRNLVSAGRAEMLLARRRSFLDAKRERGGSEEKPSHQAPKHHPLPPPRAALPSSQSLASPRKTVHLTALDTSRAEAPTKHAERTHLWGSKVGRRYGHLFSFSPPIGDDDEGKKTQRLARCRS